MSNLCYGPLDQWPTGFAGSIDSLIVVTGIIQVLPLHSFTCFIPRTKTQIDLKSIGLELKVVLVCTQETHIYLLFSGLLSHSIHEVDDILSTVFAEIFVVVLISDVTFITKFKKLNNWRCRGQHAKLARLFRN